MPADELTLPEDGDRPPAYREPIFSFHRHGKANAEHDKIHDSERLELHAPARATETSTISNDIKWPSRNVALASAIGHSMRNLL